MKVANLLSSIFTLSSIALASPVKRAESLHLRNFYVQHADDGTGALQFALHSTVTGLSDECFLSWYVVDSIPSFTTILFLFIHNSSFLSHCLSKHGISTL
jgi:hypothetical protein